MGKHYTEEEKRQIQELAQQGYPYVSIAQQLGRSTNAIRNIIHRDNIKTQTTQTIQQLQEKKLTLQQQTQQIKQELMLLEKSRNQIQHALKIEENQFTENLEREIIRLRVKKPELFTITFQDQINKLTGELATSIIRWLLK